MVRDSTQPSEGWYISKKDLYFHGDDDMVRFDDAPIQSNVNVNRKTTIEYEMGSSFDYQSSSHFQLKDPIKILWQIWALR